MEVARLCVYQGAGGACRRGIGRARGTASRLVADSRAANRQVEAVLGPHPKLVKQATVDFEGGSGFAALELLQEFWQMPDDEGAKSVHYGNSGGAAFLAAYAAGVAEHHLVFQLAIDKDMMEGLKTHAARL